MAADQANIARKKQRIMEEAFRLFAEKGIEPVTILKIAEICHTQKGTVLRYFSSKADLVVAISEYVWSSYTRQNYERADAEMQNAGQRYVFWLDSFLDLYRNHRDLLRFNQFFNVYAANEQISPEQMAPFNQVIEMLAARFHEAYQLGKIDGTLRTDIPEEEIFSTTLHLMLAAVTRYAVGLIYTGSNDPEKELETMKDMLMHRYVKQVG